MSSSFVTVSSLLGLSILKFAKESSLRINVNGSEPDSGTEPFTFVLSATRWTPRDPNKAGTAVAREADCHKLFPILSYVHNVMAKQIESEYRFEEAYSSSFGTNEIRSHESFELGYKSRGAGKLETRKPRGR